MVGAMTLVLVVAGDPAIRLAVRRTLEPAGFAVAVPGAAGARQPFAIVIAEPTAAALAALRRRYPAAAVLAVGGRSGAALGALAGVVEPPLTPSRLLGAVRLCLARRDATTVRRRRSAQRPRRPT